MPLSCADAASNSSRPFLFRTASSIRPAKSIAAAATLCPWRLARANRSLEFSVRHALGEVRYRVDAATLLHEDFARAAVGRGQARYPGFCDDPLDGFRDLATDLVRFGSVFLAGTTAEFAALVTKAERTRPPRGFAALSPGHHPARLGLGAPQDATGAERCAVSVGPVDRMFATPPDSPGQCEPGLSDDRPRDPRLCYCPELSPRATRSSSS